MTHRFSAICIAALGALSAAGCASTTINSTTTEAPEATTATTLPNGTPAELLPRLVAEAGLLSDVIGSKGDKDEQVARITNLYDALRPELVAADSVVAVSFDGAIRLCTEGARLNRPADADTCARNLTTLTNTYLADHPG